VQTSIDRDGEFEIDSLGCSKPVKALEGLSYMVALTQTDNRSGSSIENRLEAIDKSGGNSGKSSITIVKASEDEGCD